jgi:hypothetical protein
VTLHVDDARLNMRARKALIGDDRAEVREDMVRTMRQDEMARPDGRAAAIEKMRERVALAEQFLRENKRDDVLARSDSACLEQAESLAEWDRNAAGVAPCMRIAPWKGSGHDGDRE